MTDVAGELPDWRGVELGAPELARLGMARLTAVRLAMLGTVRGDGSPRISPIEPYIVDGRLLVGSMTWSGKTHDLYGDRRYVLHSIVTGPDSGEGELKLRGLAIEAAADLRNAAAGAWWLGYPADMAIVYSLSIAQALFITWDAQQGVMTFHRWSLRDGYSCAVRAYP